MPQKRGDKWIIKKFPNWGISVLSFFIKRYQKNHPGKPVDIWFFPFTLRVLIKSISTFDPDFARAFVDGRFYNGLDHAEALRRTKCAVLLLHATAERHPNFGLLGAMDNGDADRAKSLAPQIIYKKLEANHVIHVFRPNDFIAEVSAFIENNEKTKKPYLYS